MKFGKHTSRKNTGKEQMRFDQLGKGNPFTTPPGYFDKMSSDIMKAAGAVSLLALLRMKSVQIAVGIFTSAAIATAVYFFLPEKQDTNAPASTVAPAPAESMPVVKFIVSEEPAVQLIDQDKTNPTIIINPDADKLVILQMIEDLSISKQRQQFVVSRYYDFIATGSTGSDDDQLGIISPVFEDNSLFGQIRQDESSENAITPSEARSAFALLPLDTCSEQAISLNGLMPGDNHYHWSTGATTPSIQIKKSGKYWLSIITSDNRKLYKAVNVKIVPKPNLQNDYLITACAGASLRLNVGQKTGGYSYYWPQFGISSPQITISKPGLYYANVNGCQTYVDSFFVVFNHCELGIPNLITPNGDGLNETFNITNLSRYPNTQLFIYNKYNQLVYKSENYQNNWDAKSADDGSYFYILRFTDGTTQEGLITVKH